MLFLIFFIFIKKIIVLYKKYIIKTKINFIILFLYNIFYYLLFCHFIIIYSSLPHFIKIKYHFD